MIVAAHRVPSEPALRAAPAAARNVRRDARVALLPLAVVALSLPFLLRFDTSHVVIATMLGALLVGICLYSRRAGLIAALVYLLFLGDYRRWVGYLEGYTESDPLLLVGPVAALTLFCCALFEQRLSLRGAPAKLIAALMLLMVLGMFNPLQGGLQVGVAGALFYLVPLLWFWIGRAYATRDLMEFMSLRVVLGVGALATLLGLYQTYFGLLPFEQQWVERGGYGALYIADDLIRSIGFFNSSAEYQRFLLVTATILLAVWLVRRSRLALALPLVLVALFLAAARGPIVMFVGTAAVLWAVSARSTLAWPPRLIVAATACGAVLVGTLLFLQTLSFGERVGLLVDRQVQGLLDPANEESSTATGHLTMLLDGIAAGVTSPAGQGLGITTLAAAKYGEGILNAEIDFANVMLALGILGGLLYAAIVIGVLRNAVAWWKAERQVVPLITLGILLATFGGWLIGAEYSMAALVWLYVGAMDKLAHEARSRKRGRRREHSAHYA